MKPFDMRQSFHGYSSSSIVKSYYDRAWSTHHGAKKAIVARAVELYLEEIAEEHRTIKFNLPEDPNDSDQFLESCKKNVKIVDDFFADNAVRSKHFRDNLEIFVARAIDEIYETDICEILKTKLFPESVTPHTQAGLDQLLIETNSCYTDAINACVQIFRNGLGDDTNHELETLETKLKVVREKLDKNMGVIADELSRRKQKEP